MKSLSEILSKEVIVVPSIGLDLMVWRLSHDNTDEYVPNEKDGVLILPISDKLQLEDITKIGSHFKAYLNKISQRKQ